jgi:hypothetical protein
MMNVRPHPGPLPQERENRLQRAGDASMPVDLRHPQADYQKTAAAYQKHEFSGNVASPSLFPGERAGVRAGVNLHLVPLLLPVTAAAFPVFPT